MPVPAKVMTLSEILERFYIKDNVLMRKNDINSYILKDEPVGSIDKATGYIKVKINSKKFTVHRIMYQIYHNLEELPIHMLIEHVDGNNLNNSKENLRLVSVVDNNHTMSKSSANTSGYIGVSWEERAKAWRVSIRVEGTKHFLGNYTDHVKAAEAYDVAAIRRDAKNHVLNFPEKKEQYLKHIEEHGVDITERDRKPKGIQSGERHITYVANQSGTPNWRCKIIKDGEKHQKHFQYSSDGLSSAIQWRNATYERLYGRPFTE
jgi:hypothetical protein